MVGNSNSRGGGKSSPHEEGDHINIIIRVAECHGSRGYIRVKNVAKSGKIILHSATLHVETNLCSMCEMHGQICVTGQTRPKKIYLLQLRE